MKYVIGFLLGFYLTGCLNSSEGDLWQVVKAGDQQPNSVVKVKSKGKVMSCQPVNE